LNSTGARYAVCSVILSGSEILNSILISNFEKNWRKLKLITGKSMNDDNLVRVVALSYSRIHR
jgi:hypothetical protein